jgi:hypothetical protein
LLYLTKSNNYHFPISFHLQILWSASLEDSWLVTRPPSSIQCSRKQWRSPCPLSHDRLHSDSSSKLILHASACTLNIPGHYRHSSELGFMGFDSLTEVRRGFKFLPSTRSYVSWSGQQAWVHIQHGIYFVIWTSHQ